MKFLVIVTSHPTHPTSIDALHFCRAVINKNHALYRVFFQAEGVLNGVRGYPLQQQWCSLKTQFGFDTLCCVNSLEEHEIAYDKEASKLSKEFTAAGLGQLVEASVSCDRVITFGHRDSC